MSVIKAKYSKLFFTVLAVISAIPTIDLKDYKGVRFIGIRNNEHFNKNITFEHSGIKTRFHKMQDRINTGKS